MPSIQNTVIPRDGDTVLVEQSDLSFYKNLLIGLSIYSAIQSAILIFLFLRFCFRKLTQRKAQRKHDAKEFSVDKFVGVRQVTQRKGKAKAKGEHPPLPLPVPLPTPLTSTSPSSLSSSMIQFSPGPGLPLDVRDGGSPEFVVMDVAQSPYHKFEDTTRSPVIPVAEGYRKPRPLPHPKTARSLSEDSVYASPFFTGDPHATHNGNVKQGRAPIISPYYTYALSPVGRNLPEVNSSRRVA